MPPRLPSSDTRLPPPPPPPNLVLRHERDLSPSPSSSSSSSSGSTTTPSSSSSSSTSSRVPRRRSRAGCTCRRGQGPSGSSVRVGVVALTVVGALSTAPLGAHASPVVAPTATALTPRQFAKSRLHDDQQYVAPAGPTAPPGSPHEPGARQRGGVLVQAHPDPENNNNNKRNQQRRRGQGQRGDEHELEKRLVVDKLVYTNGAWELDPEWTLHGSVGGGTDRTASGGDLLANTALQENLDVLTTSRRVSTLVSLSLISSGTATSTSSTVILATNTPKIAAAASPTSTDVTIPSGWQATPRETNFYAVPVIIAMSIIVSIAVVTVVVGSVVWRKNLRTKKNKHDRAEKGRMGRMMEKVGFGSSNEKGAGGGAARGKKGKKTRRATAAATAALDRVESRAGSDAGSGSTGSGRPVGGQRGSVMSANGRLRQRRRRMAATAARGEGGALDDDEEEDEARTALTGSQVDRPARPVTPNDTLTSRLAHRLRHPLQRASSLPTNGPSTVFSRDLDLTTTRSSTLSSGRLSRVSTRHSTHSAFATTALGDQLDHSDPVSPVLSPSSSRPSSIRSNRQRTGSVSSSNFGLFSSSEVALPAPGPPAYRPASSTVAATTRLTASRIPAPRIVVEPEERTVAEEDQWHWPNEKGVASSSSSAAPAGSSSSSIRAVNGGSSRTRRSSRIAPPPLAAETEEEVEEDDAAPTVFAAHLATDDKAVLARLRDQAGSPSIHSSTSVRPSTPLATAPPQQDDDDEFEQLPLAAPTPSAPNSTTSNSALPLPPQPIATFDYTRSHPTPQVQTSSDSKSSYGPQSTGVEGGFLPVYLPRDDARAEEIDNMASAPPAVEDEEDEEEDVVRDNEGNERRGEHAEV